MEICRKSKLWAAKILGDTQNHPKKHFFVFSMSFQQLLFFLIFIKNNYFTGKWITYGSYK
jgi:hypothetical protein